MSAWKKKKGTDPILYTKIRNGSKYMCQRLKTIKDKVFMTWVNKNFSNRTKKSPVIK